MHQTAQEFFFRMEREKRDSGFALNRYETHRAITTTLVGYLMTCFNSDVFSKVKRWDEEDFRVYADYLGEWPLIKYAIPNLKHHYGLCGRRGIVRDKIGALVRHLSQRLCSRFLGDWFADQLETRDPGWLLTIAPTNVPLPAVASRTTPEEFGFRVLDIVAMKELIWVFETMVNPCTHFGAQAGEVPLVSCARGGLVNASRMCLSNGAHVDATGTNGKTALHQAAENGNEAIVRVLLEGGANKSIKDDLGFIALEIALEKL